MDEIQSGKSMIKAITLVVLVAIVTAIVTTVAQVLLWGSSKAAITGGVVGAVTAVAAISAMRNKKGNSQTSSEK